MEDLVKVPIFIESRYKVNRKKITERVKKTLTRHHFEGPIEVSVAIVGDRKMRTLNKKYRNLDKTTNVLSFSLAEGQKAPTPTDAVYLGDVVLSYPEVIREAAEKELLVDDRVCDLVEHGLLHLLGEHHE